LHVYNKIIFADLKLISFAHTVVKAPASKAFPSLACVARCL